MITCLDGLLPLKSHDPFLITWSCKITWQKPLYLHYHCVYCHQTWQDGDIHWQAPNHKVTQSFDHVVLQGHGTNKNLYISTTVPMATGLGRVMTYLDGLRPLKSHDPLITWLCEIMWQTNHCISNTTVPMATKHGRRMAYLEQKMTKHFDHVAWQSHVTNKSHYISTTRFSMVTKLDRMATYLDVFLLIYSPDPLITWSC